MDKIINKNLVLFLFVFLLVLDAFGNFFRWTINDQIGMADNLLNFGSLYPVNGLYTTVSVYPPGVGIFTAVLMKLGLESIIYETLFLTAIAILFLAVFLFKSIILENGVKSNSILSLIIILTTLLCRDFIDYASEFKPDALAFFLCFLGLHFLEKNKNLKGVIIGSILTAASIIFKQQAIAFTLGILLFGLFNRKNKNLNMYIILLLFFQTILFIILTQNTNVYMFSFEVLSDDGFYPIGYIFSDLWDLTKKIFFTLVVLILLTKKKFAVKLNDFNNKYVFIALSIMAASLLSSMKVGGNIGNIQVGLFCSIPALFIVLKEFEISKKVKIIAPMILIMSFNLGSFRSLHTYYSTLKEVEHLLKDNQLILTDSDSYSIARRFLGDNVIIENVNTFLLLNPQKTIQDMGVKKYDIIILNEPLEKSDLINKELYKNFSNEIYIYK